MVPLLPTNPVCGITQLVIPVPSLLNTYPAVVLVLGNVNPLTVPTTIRPVSVIVARSSSIVVPPVWKRISVPILCVPTAKSPPLINTYPSFSLTMEYAGLL